MAGEPFPKQRQLERGPKRYRRKVASAKAWQKTSDEKRGPCRVCNDPGSNGRLYGKVHLHHIVPRDRGGDDTAANVLPLCPACHDRVTRLDTAYCIMMILSLTLEEHEYVREHHGGLDALLPMYGLRVMVR